MKTAIERLRQRLRKDRPMAVISIRIPEDVVDELKEVAPLLGFSGYQPLMRTYIGQGLRKDVARLQNTPIEMIVESLRKQGVSEDVIAAALATSQPDSSRTGSPALAPTL